MRIVPVILLLIGSVAECLNLYRVQVPHFKKDGEDAELECEFEMGRNNHLYAVKWYKDDEEFFKYVPRFKPPISTHRVEGVKVDVLESNAKTVRLREVGIGSTGVYRCEVSAEAPAFVSRQGEGRMTVVYLPKDGPQITGIAQDEYEVGDMLDLNCTSSKSFPPAQLTWFVNGSPVGSPWVTFQHDSPYTDARDGRLSGGGGYSLVQSTLRLRLQLALHHFGSKGLANVRCIASISTPLWQDGDERTVGNSGRRDLENKDSNELSVETFDSKSKSHLANFHSAKYAFVDTKEAHVFVRGFGSSLTISSGLFCFVLAVHCWLWTFHKVDDVDNLS